MAAGRRRLGDGAVTDPRLRLVTGTQLAEHGDAVLRALDGIRVVLKLTGAPPGTNASIRLLVSLAVRLFSHVDIDGDAAAGTTDAPIAAGQLLEQLRWVRPIATATPTSDRTISIGGATGRPVDLGIGGSVFTCRVGREPQPVHEAPGPLLGVQAAVCLAVAELVKDLLGPVGFTAKCLSGSLAWDLLTYQLGDHVEPVIPLSANRPAVALAGVGSVGTSTVAALLSGNEPFVGEVDLIDPEVFDDRNPYRYSALITDLTGREKVGWAAQMLRAAGINAHPFRGSVGPWVESRPTPGFDGLLVASPDTLAGRRDVTVVLARTTLSIGVAGLSFHVARHHLGDGLACPYCEYVPLGPPTTQADVYAAQTGLDVARVLRLMQADAVLTAEDVAVVQAAGRVGPETAMALVGHRLEDLVARAYAEVGISASAGSGEGQVYLAAPYVSALAGVLAAAEIYKISLGLPGVDRRVDLDLSGVPQGYVRRPPADATGRCLCASPFRRRFMRRPNPSDGST